MPDKDLPSNVTFPLGGLNVAGEFQEQPADTTPTATNVRGLNPDSRRERGGSRAGLFRYIPGPLFSGADAIQHLNVIVDPTGEALQQNFYVPEPDWVEDPLNPGFFVPPGGWGYGPSPQEELAGYVQGNSVGHAFESGVTSSNRSIAFTGALGGDRVIVAFFFIGDTNSPSVSMSDTQGNTYTLREELVSASQRIQCWTAPAQPGACTVTAAVTTGAPDIAASKLVITEYKGVKLTGAGLFVDAVSNSTSYTNVSGSQTQTTTKVTCESATTNFVISCFDLPMGNSAVDVNILKGAISFGPSPNTFTRRITGPQTGLLQTNPRIFVADSLAGDLTLVAGGVDATMTFDLGASVVSFTAKAIAIALRKA